MNLEIGDTGVVTTGQLTGMTGSIVSLTPNRVRLRVQTGIYIEVLQSCVGPRRALGSAGDQTKASI